MEAAPEPVMEAGASEDVSPASPEAEGGIEDPDSWRREARGLL